MSINITNYKSVKWSNNDNVFCNKCIITYEEIFDKV